MQNFYEAAIIGEYLGDRFPGFSSARAASRIALACYEQTSYLDPKTRDVDVRQMTRVANLIVDRWPKEPEADIALMTLGKIHLDAANTDPTRLDEAISTLATIIPALTITAPSTGRARRISASASSRRPSRA